MAEAFRLAIARAAKQPASTPRYAHNFPDWGHKAADELTKTIFKGIVRMAPIENDSPKILAHKAGKLLGFLIRAAVFYWKEVPAQIERDGLNKLTTAQEEKLEKIAGLELLLPQASELAGRPITGKAELVTFSRRWIMNFVMRLVRINLALMKLILHRSSEEIFEFLSGIPKGFKAFLKTDGEFAGKGKRTEIYVVLLTCWPEIEEMRLSQSPRTRKHLLEWLEKEEGKQLCVDPKVFYELCGDIGLDLAPPGHPPGASPA